MPKASKKEFEETFNKLLGTNIKWSLLRYEDLIELAVLFNHPEILLKRLGVDVEKEAGRRRLIEAGIETVKEIANQWQGPLARLLRKILEEPKGGE